MTAYYVIARESQDLRSLLQKEMALLPPEGAPAGWAFYEVPDTRGIEVVERDLDRAAPELGPFLYAAVEDGSYAYIFGGDSAIEWRYVFEPELALDSADGLWALSSTQRNGDRDLDAEDTARRIAAWSRAFPCPLSTEDVLRRITDRTQLADTFLVNSWCDVGLDNLPRLRIRFRLALLNRSSLAPVAPEPSLDGDSSMKTMTPVTP